MYKTYDVLKNDVNHGQHSTNSLKGDTLSSIEIFKYMHSYIQSSIIFDV